MGKQHKVRTEIRSRDRLTGTFVPVRQAKLSPGRVVTVNVKFVPQKGPTITVGRDSNSGRFTTARSAQRIQSTSVRAADSLKRLAKR